MLILNAIFFLKILNIAGKNILMLLNFFCQVRGTGSDM